MSDPASEKKDQVSEETGGPIYLKVDELREDGDSSCLRPLGLCDLGGCCDVCWYNPEKRKERARPG